MDEQIVDVAILGAGPAGSVAAHELGKSGLSVVLIESGDTTDVHCIESFPQSGAPLAESTGLLSAICSAAYAPAQSMTLHWRAQAEVRDFGNAGPLLVHRRELHHALLSQARSASPATTVVKARVRKVQRVGELSFIETDTGRVKARLTLEARGRVEARRMKKPAGTHQRHALVALPFSVRCRSGVAAMSLEALPEAWVWVAHTGDGEAHGAIFQNASMLAGQSLQQRVSYGTSCIQNTRCLNQSTEALRFHTPTAADFIALDDPVINDACFAIGDAALARNPVASHGLVHALRSGVQAAAAVRTVLSAQHQSDAAFAFLRHKHSDAYRNALTATARAYTESRFNTAFWQCYASMKEPPVAPTFPMSQVLTLTEPLAQAPVLDGDFIHWAPAIALPLKQDYAVQIGPLAAAEIASACQPAAALPELAARLQRFHNRKIVADVFDALLAGGALSPV